MATTMPWGYSCPPCVELFSVHTFSIRYGATVVPIDLHLTHIVHGKSSFNVIFLHNTIVSQVSAHGHLNITRDFGPHGDINSISLYRNCYIDPLKCEWALARDTTVLSDEMLQS